MAARATGSLLLGSGTQPNPPRISPTVSRYSSVCTAASFACLFGVGAGLITHKITKNPIISMTRSANVKIHSGHSSHSAALHLHAAAFLDMLITSQKPGARSQTKTNLLYWLLATGYWLLSYAAF